MVKEREAGDYIYDLDDYIGKGKFGIVYGCRYKYNSKNRLCIKILQSDKETNALREVEILNALIDKGNKNTVKVEHAALEKDKIIIILERCDGDLKQLLEKRKELCYTPQEAFNIVAQIVNGYRPLFCYNIIHRDLKPANILYKGDVFKIGDFGFARIISEDMTFCGTPQYAAPQLLQGKKYTNSADIYSIGVILYQLIFGEFPFEVSKKDELKYKPIKVDRKKEGLTEEMCQLIEWMLMYDEQSRIKWAQLFTHPLMELQNFEKSQYFEAQDNDTQHFQVNQKISTQPLTPQINQFTITIPQDCFFHMGLLYDKLFLILSKYMQSNYGYSSNLQNKVSKEITEIKIVLYCFAYSFYEQSKVEQYKNHLGTVSWHNIKKIFEKQNKIKSVLNQIDFKVLEEEERLHYSKCYQFQPILLNFQKYQQKLVQLYQQERQKFRFSKKKVYLEYIQYIFIVYKVIVRDGKIWRNQCKDFQHF